MYTYKITTEHPTNGVGHFKYEHESPSAFVAVLEKFKADHGNYLDYMISCESFDDQGALVAGLTQAEGPPEELLEALENLIQVDVETGEILISDGYCSVGEVMATAFVTAMHQLHPNLPVAELMVEVGKGLTRAVDIYMGLPDLGPDVNLDYGFKWGEQEDDHDGPHS